MLTSSFDAPTRSLVTTSEEIGSAQLRTSGGSPAEPAFGGSPRLAEAPGIAGSTRGDARGAGRGSDVDVLRSDDHRLACMAEQCWTGDEAERASPQHASASTLPLARRLPDRRRQDRVAVHGEASSQGLAAAERASDVSEGHAAMMVRRRSARPTVPAIWDRARSTWPQVCAASGRKRRMASVRAVWRFEVRTTVVRVTSRTRARTSKVTVVASGIRPR
jgi:hypothetical protein